MANSWANSWLLTWLDSWTSGGGVAGPPVGDTLVSISPSHRLAMLDYISRATTLTAEERRVIIEQRTLWADIVQDLRRVDIDRD